MFNKNKPFVKIAIVGLSGAGKTVLISTILHHIERSQRNKPDISLDPVGDNRYSTLVYALQNWNILESCKWPPSTPAGDFIKMEWEAKTSRAKGIVNLIDCAGQDLRTLFGRDKINPDELTEELRNLYENLTQANVLIVLINTKDLVQYDNSEELASLNQMFHVLLNKHKIPRKVTIVLSQYDQYKDEVEQKFQGDLNEFLYEHLPYLYNQYLHNHLGRVHTTLRKNSYIIVS